MADVITSALPDADPEWLQEAADSLSTQTTPPECWHLIWDGPDPGIDIDYPYPMNRLALHTHMGLSVTRNRLLGDITTDRFTFLDADDILPSRSLQVREETLDRHPDAAFAAGPTLFLENGTLGPHHSHGPWLPGALPSRTLLEHALDSACDPGIVGGAIMYRTEVVIRHGGWTAVPRSGDWHLLLRINAAHPGAWTSEPVYHYRMHPRQMTRDAPIANAWVKPHMMRMIEALLAEA